MDNKKYSKPVVLILIILIIIGLLFVMTDFSNIDSVTKKSCDNINYQDENNNNLKDISTVYELKCINTSQNYELTNNINASVTSEWNNGTGFKPIGNESNHFDGVLDGNNYKINNIYLSNNESSSLIHTVSRNSTVKNINIKDVNIDYENNSDYIRGYNSEEISVLALENRGTIKNINTSGYINSLNRASGLVDYNMGVILNSSSYFVINGGANSAGLVTNNYGDIIGSHSESKITGDQKIGGLVGNNYEGNISESYAQGEVTGEKNVGGLVGENYEGNIELSYSKSKVNGSVNVGGFIGYNNQGKINNSYTNSTVTGEKKVGGFVGTDRDTIIRSYSNSEVDGEEDVGGFVGSYKVSYGCSFNTGYCSGSYNNYHNSDKSGFTESEFIGNDAFRSIPLTTEQMYGYNAKDNMPSFDFKDVWETVNDKPPRLK